MADTRNTKNKTAQINRSIGKISSANTADRHDSATDAAIMERVDTLTERFRLDNQRLRRLAKKGIDPS